ncbi:ABC transporter permease [Alkaliphilus peptidifermentans]|uniref:Putative spermidine/putrescine transport system permease protein n=1 Tax=Alkaliphilus peptidifermentans DSM 18978 TaxID=1120976 RepID=A0A1G5CDH9_9FIRM|nr:ABC transporter permease [Alkaliphilus peptidifermentans]SCY00406.1 putative spermidine/putrescine transport system permease protein [Alkaliphilus peptidifermentans DSM 18978]
MKQNKGLFAFVILVYSFLFIPIIIIAATSFGSESYVAFPPRGFSLKWYHNVFTTESFIRTFKISMEVSVLATLIALALGIPGAYALTRFDFKGKTLLKNFFFSPKIVPGVVTGFVMFQFIVINLKLPIYYSLLLGLSIFEIPYAIRVIGSSLEMVDYTMEEAAMSLGASRLQTFFRVVFPNITSGIIASFMLSFISAFNNVPVTLFLSGPGISTLPITMMNYVEYNYDPTISALSVLLMLMTIGIMFVVEKTLGINNL